MPDVFASSGYHGTFIVGSAETDPHYQISAVANINASNMIESTIWLMRNGERVVSNLISANYRIRDKNGSLLSGLSQSGILPDINGYFRITPVASSLIYDMTHFVFEIDIFDEEGTHSGSIGMTTRE